MGDRATSEINLLGFAMAVLVVVATGGCRTIEYEDHWMDSPLTEDPSVAEDDARVSLRFPSPTAAQLATPVIVTAHGFSASSYEWVEFRDYAEGRVDGEPKGALVSLCVLAGHGRSTEAWAETTWKEWSDPTLEEYRALRALGYQRVYLALSSTAGALFVSDLLEGAFDDVAPPDGVYMVAPLVVLGEKLIYTMDFIGWAVGSVENDVNEEERKLFYTNVPAHVLSELRMAAESAENALREGVSLPPDMNVRVVGGAGDTVVDPVSFDLVGDGLLPDGGSVAFEELDTDIHVHTRGVARTDFTDADIALQLETFDDILAFAE